MRSRRQTAIGRRQRRRDLSGSGVLIGFVVAGIVTLVLGLPLYLVTDSALALAGVSLLGLLAGGMAAGLRAHSTEPLNGALVGALGYVAAAAGIGVLEYAAGRDEPLAGAVGGAWFYIAWGLLMVAAALAGGVIGGRMVKAR